MPSKKSKEDNIHGKSRKKGVLTRFGEKFSIWANRWVPSSLVLVLMLTILAAALALLLCRVPFFFSTAEQTSVVDAWGKGFWALLTFSMQMCLIMITGDVLANTPIIKRGITKIASAPKSQFQAIIILALVVFVTRWVHWGFGMMIGIVLGREMLAQAKLKGIRIHKVSMAAVSYCITCATIGISTSGPLYVAGSGWLASYVPESYKNLVPDSVPLTDTVLTPVVLAQCVLLGILTVVMVYAMMPKSKTDVVEITDEFRDEILSTASLAAEKKSLKGLAPADRINNSPVLNILIGAVGLFYCINMLVKNGIVNLSVDSLNLLMLMLGLLLHKSPAAFTRAVASSVGSVASVIIQFPLYAGIYGIINYTGLTGVIADFFKAIANAHTFPAITFVYSAILNFFVPSAGSKFIIEVPYIIPTAIDLGSDLPAVINAYSFGDYATIEMGSMDCGTFNWMPNYVFMNSPNFLRQLAAVYTEKGIKPEVEVFDVSMMNCAKLLIKEGVLKAPVHYQFCLGAPGGMEATVDNLQYLLHNLPEGSTWSAFGTSKAHMPILYAALALGGNIRVGLEDNVYYAKGIKATNSMLVERAVKAVGLFGKQAGTPAQAREILGIPPLAR